MADVCSRRGYLYCELVEIGPVDAAECCPITELTFDVYWTLIFLAVVRKWYTLETSLIAAPVTTGVSLTAT